VNYSRGATIDHEKHTAMRLKKPLQNLAVTLALCATLSPALAQQQVKIGIGFGLAFLPIYICEDLKLIEKHAREAHLDVKASFPRFLGSGPLRDAIASGEIELAPFGTAPLLAAWEKGKGTPGQIFAVSGITSLPLVLISNQAGVHSIADLKPTDRIAMPTLSSPQMYLLQLQSEKVFHQYDRLQKQVVALPHADAMSALIEGAGRGAEHVTAYFSSPPFAELALRDANLHSILTSSEVIGGEFSFLVLGATKAFIEAQPQLPEAIDKAIDEAARLIRDDPRRAAQIYLTHEPSKTLDGATAEALVREIKDEFGSAVYGVQAIADFMGRRGELKSPPRSWKDVVAPSLLNSPST
jgi:sulfonate transport system substrate-binding protein